MQRLGPPLPPPGVTQAVGAQQRRQWNAAPHVAPREIERLARDDDVVDACVVGKQSQHLADVGLSGDQQLHAQDVVLNRRELGNGG